MTLSVEVFTIVYNVILVCYTAKSGIVAQKGKSDLYISLFSGYFFRINRIAVEKKKKKGREKPQTKPKPDTEVQKNHKKYP